MYCYNSSLSFIDLNCCYPVYLKYIVNKNKGKVYITYNGEQIKNPHI